MRTGLAVVAILLLGALRASVALAHGGGLDRHGCHHDRKTGDYHCHRGGADDVTTGDSSGQVGVIDGDSLRMRGVEVRLQGIDAVEGKQTCKRPDGKRWACGKEATRALRAFIAKRAVSCVHHGKDAYGRTLATCSVDSANINEWLVRQGWAVAYTRYSGRYVEAEAEAKAAQRNIWSGTFTKPERFRHQKRN